MARQRLVPLLLLLFAASLGALVIGRPTWTGASLSSSASARYAYDLALKDAPGASSTAARGPAPGPTESARPTTITVASPSSVASGVGAETGSELSPAVIGEGMKSRVVPFAEANGYETYAGLANPENYTSEELLAHNSAQIETWMNEGRTIYDVGPEPGRAFYPMETSPNYGMEHNLVRGYGGYQPVTLPGEANWWELLDVP